jgi:hypothetical protein
MVELADVRVHRVHLLGLRDLRLRVDLRDSHQAHEQQPRGPDHACAVDVELAVSHLARHHDFEFPRRMLDHHFPLVLLVFAFVVVPVISSYQGELLYI